MMKTAKNACVHSLTRSLNKYDNNGVINAASQKLGQQQKAPFCVAKHHKLFKPSTEAIIYNETIKTFKRGRKLRCSPNCGWMVGTERRI